RLSATGNRSMQTPAALLRFIGRAILNAAGAGFVGDFAADVLPEMARDIWGWWNNDRHEAQKRLEMEALAQAQSAEIRRVVKEVLADIASDQPPEVQQKLALYLLQVPATVRRTLRRPSDATGTTLPPALALRKPEDLLPFLPAGLPRFQAGDRP